MKKRTAQAMAESETRKQNRIRLTQYWEDKGVKLHPLETIDDYIVVPGDKTDWAFYPLVKWFKRKLKHV
jgi:hypothetical protein